MEQETKENLTPGQFTYKNSNQAPTKYEVKKKIPTTLSPCSLQIPLSQNSIQRRGNAGMSFHNSN